MVKPPCLIQLQTALNRREIAKPGSEDNGCASLPVLGDVKAPLKVEMGLLVVVDKARNGIVVATGKHAGGGLFLLD